MTRAEEIRVLQARYLKAVSDHKPKTASIIFARLSALMTRQLRAEMRKEVASA